MILFNAEEKNLLAVGLFGFGSQSSDPQSKSSEIELAIYLALETIATRRTH